MNLTLVQAHNSFGLDYIKKHILATPTRTKEDYYWHFKEIFETRPDEIFLILTLDEADIMHGFLIAAQHIEQPYVWLYQMYADKIQTLQMKQLAMDRMEIWTEEVLGLKEIRGEMLGKTHPGFGLYGYEQYSTVYNKILGD